jgi:catechol-2,3-dioxygenase
MFATVWLIAAGGFLQHLAFRKHQRRTIIGHVHMWVGRVIITLAFINGGLGLQLAGEHGGKVIAYGVVAALIWVAWMGITFFWPNKGKRLDG